MLEAIPVSQTIVEMPVRMLPMDANPAGVVHGGVILRQLDLVGGIAAGRHARSRIATLSVDRMEFLAPVQVGEVLILKACINGTGRTSMEVGVRLEAEDMFTGIVRHVGTAYMTIVSLDETGKPAPVAQVKPESPEEIRRFADAKRRREARHAERRRARRAD